MRVFPLFAILLLTACSTLNEGATDYRRATAPAGDVGHMTLVAKFDSDGKLTDQKVNAATPVRDKDTFYIALTTAFINAFTERFDTQSVLYGERVGEIAIVIRAEEIPPDSELDWDYGSRLSDKKGRVVFYSNDVRQGQFLNFPFMPVLGPTKYNGGPILLDVYVIEVDSDTNAQYSSILTALAKLGKDAFALGQPALTILDTVGSKLLSGQESDDIEMHYSALLLPMVDDAAQKNYPKLEVGDYVFARLHDRSEDLAWSELRFDPNTARLVSPKPKCKPLDAADTPAVRSSATAIDQIPQRVYDDAPVRDDDCIFRGATYLTLQVNKGSFKEAKLKTQTLKQLSEALKKSNIDAVGLASDVTKIVSDAKTEQQLEALTKALHKVQDAKRTATVDASAPRYLAADAFLMKLKLALTKYTKASDQFTSLMESAAAEMEKNNAAIAKTFTAPTLKSTSPSSDAWKKWLTALSVEPKAATP